MRRDCMSFVPCTWRRPPPVSPSECSFKLMVIHPDPSTHPRKTDHDSRNENLSPLCLARWGPPCPSQHGPMHHVSAKLQLKLGNVSAGITRIRSRCSVNVSSTTWPGHRRLCPLRGCRAGPQASLDRSVGRSSRGSCVQVQPSLRPEAWRWPRHDRDQWQRHCPRPSTRVVLM